MPNTHIDTFVPRPALSSSAHAALVTRGIPLQSLEDACRSCAQDVDDVEDYPKGFDVDFDSVLLGTMQDYGRQILISTSKSDWGKEVTEVVPSLAAMVKGAYEGDAAPGPLSKLADKVSKKLKLSSSSDPEGEDGIKGIYPSSARRTPDQLAHPSTVPPRLSILNSSFHSSSHLAARQSVIVLPDFTVVHEVEETPAGAEALVDRYLRDTVGRGGLGQGTSSLRSWPLPYHAVVLLCSHKRRDKRCHIAAPLLLSQFHHHLEAHGLEGDETGDDLSDGPPIEEWDAESRAVKLEESLKGVKRNGGRVGLFKISHIGGHRYAGNVIIAFPNGTSIWYGRVKPRDVGAIVESTILKGLVLPELLRGGLGLAGKQKDVSDGIMNW